MSEMDSTPTGENTQPQDDSSPTPLKKSASGKPYWEETADEAADRVQKMMIENLKNPANHSAYREYPKDK